MGIFHVFSHVSQLYIVEPCLAVSRVLHQFFVYTLLCSHLNIFFLFLSVFLSDISYEFPKGLVQRVFGKAVTRVFHFHAFVYQTLLPVTNDGSYCTGWEPCASFFSFLRASPPPIRCSATRQWRISMSSLY